MSDKQFNEYRPKVAFSAGLLAGVAYLVKAYTLPFCLLYIVLTTSLNRFVRVKPPFVTHRGKTALAMLCFLGLGVGLLVGPWIACLSWKCGHLTFSTAGSANHANMSPDNFRKDPLWNPGLTPDFIFEPRLSPDWSALQDVSHHQHQISIVTYNVLNCIGLIPIWLGVFMVCFLTLTRSKCTIVQPEIPYICWVIMTVGVYCGGYTVVNLEAMQMEKFRNVAEELCTNGVADVPFACSDWHFGPYIAYAADRLTNYWGSPLAGDASQAINELEAKDVKVYLRFVTESDDSNKSKRDTSYGANRSWTRTLTICRREFGPKYMEVYERR